MSSERQPDARLDWAKLLDEALELPGSVSGAYNAFYNYSFLNCLRLYQQGVEPQPIATYQRWKELGRQVVKGAKAREIIRPITVKREDEDGNEVRITRFKGVRCVFPLEDTTGPDLPEIATPEWSLDRALEQLDIKRVPFEHYNGNILGYSFERTIALNPVGNHLGMTALHEVAHIEHGHTTPERSREYAQHRGVYEFEAEGSAFLAGKELDMLTPQGESESRGYLQGWLRGEDPPERSIRAVFKVTDTIIKAGRLAVSAAEEAA